MATYFIAIPAYDNRIFCECFSSVVGNILDLQALGHRVVVATDSGNCYLDRTRNRLADRFLKSKCHAMIFVDADMSFEHTAFRKLVGANKDLVFAAYPHKNIEPTKWTTNPVDAGDGKVNVVNGMMQCHFGPTGLMLIKRKVFADIAQRFPDLLVDEEGMNYFATGQVLGDGKWTGEDVVFCRRFVAAGGECWCYLDIEVDHIGVSHTRGNCMRYVRERFLK